MQNWVLPEIKLDLCTGCGVCVRECPTQALEMRAAFPVFSRSEACTYCTDCEALCPQHAIRCAFEIGWQPVTLEEVIQ
ncbi:MAG: 4Fe-4S binding protein [Anaerolineaceae bacterium]|nr:4Fe-4S binding protein [Anaerolineaceae bacterium]